MKVTSEKVEDRQAFLTIEVEPSEIEASMDKSYQRLVKRASIPGFRKGKAPRSIVERYLGKEKVFEEALNDILPEAYEKAIKEKNIEAYAQPEIEVEKTEPLIFTARVPLAPVIKLGDYKSTRVEEKPVEVTEADIDATIERLRHQHATWEPAERPVELHDLVTLDVESTMDGKPFINQKGAQYQVLKDLPLPVAGFAEQLAGLKAGEEKEFQIKLPDDYGRKELQGKEISFKVKVAEVKQEKMPEINDDFAKSVGPELKDMAALREEVGKELKHNTEDKSRLDYEDRVITALANISEVEYPPVLVEMEIDNLIEQQMRRWQMDEKGLDAYLKSMNKTAAELREELRPAAVKRVKEYLALDKVAEEEKIGADEAEIDAEIERTVASARDANKDELRKALNAERARHSIEHAIIDRKTMERLVSIAKGEVTETKPVEEKKE